MNKQEKKKKFAELGSKGGRATAEKHGSAYMREIGLKGLAKRYAKKKKGRKNANQSNDKQNAN